MRLQGFSTGTSVLVENLSMRLQGFSTGTDVLVENSWVVHLFLWKTQRVPVEKPVENLRNPVIPVACLWKTRICR